MKPFPRNWKMPSTAKALIDTQIFLWMATTPERLSPSARAACESSDLVLSVASVWEIAIKHHIGKLPLPTDIRIFLDRQIRFANLTLLPIHYLHTLRAAALPGDHKDPFDRLIAAQAVEESLPCITADPQLATLGVTRIW